MTEASPFAALRALLARHRGDALVTTDSDSHYALARPDAKGAPAFLASVQVKKSYIALHLFPVYCNPSLLDAISPELLRRMQGKSCFNFKTSDAALFMELDGLIARALAD